jgi:hypothetical protein
LSKFLLIGERGELKGTESYKSSSYNDGTASMGRGRKREVIPFGGKNLWDFGMME